MLACDGLSDVGGLDLDAAIVAHLRATTPGADRAWGRITWPETASDQRARQSLWREASAAKEQLSRQASAPVHIPLVEVDTHVTREEFERLARPFLDRTVAMTVATLRTSGTAQESIAGVFLVGGSSRISLAARLLHKGAGRPTHRDRTTRTRRGGRALRAINPDPPMPPRPAAAAVPLRSAGVPYMLQPAARVPAAAAPDPSWKPPTCGCRRYLCGRPRPPDRRVPPDTP